MRNLEVVGSKQRLFSKKALDAKNLYMNKAIGWTYENPATGNSILTINKARCKMDLLNEELLAPCGLYCGECLGFQEGKCGGCISRKGLCLKYSKVCNIYECCVEKRKHRFCNECRGFPCKKIDRFFNTPEWNAKVATNLKQISERGAKKFLDSEAKRVAKLISCAKKRGIKHCSQCKNWPCERLNRPALVPE